MAGDPLTPAGFIQQGLLEGLSGNKILAGLRDAGMGVRRATGLRLIGEIKSALASRNVAPGLDPGLMPNDDAYTPMSGGKNGQYLHQVSVFVRNKDFDTEYPIEFSFITNVRMSPQEAEDTAMDSYGDAAEDYGEVVYGAMLTHLYKMGQR